MLRSARCLLAGSRSCRLRLSPAAAAASPIAGLPAIARVQSLHLSRSAVRMYVPTSTARANGLRSSWLTSSHPPRTRGLATDVQSEALAAAPADDALGKLSAHEQQALLTSEVRQQLKQSSAPRVALRHNTRGDRLVEDLATPAIQAFKKLRQEDTAGLDDVAKALLAISRQAMRCGEVVLSPSVALPRAMLDPQAELMRLLQSAKQVWSTRHAVLQSMFTRTKHSTRHNDADSSTFRSQYLRGIAPLGSLEPVSADGTSAGLHLQSQLDQVFLTVLRSSARAARVASLGGTYLRCLDSLVHTACAAKQMDQAVMYLRQLEDVACILGSMTEKSSGASRDADTDHHHVTREVLNGLQVSSEDSMFSLICKAHSSLLRAYGLANKPREALALYVLFFRRYHCVTGRMTVQVLQNILPFNTINLRPSTEVSRPLMITPADGGSPYEIQLVSPWQLPPADVGLQSTAVAQLKGAALIAKYLGQLMDTPTSSVPSSSSSAAAASAAATTATTSATTTPAREALLAWPLLASAPEYVPAELIAIYRESEEAEVTYCVFIDVCVYAYQMSCLHLPVHRLVT